MADLCTLADVKAYLTITGTGDDALITSLVTRVSRLIERYLDRKIAATPALTEFYDGPDDDVLIIRNYPIITVTSIHHDEERLFPAGTLIDAADYFIELERGQIFREGGGRWHQGVPKNHKVIYSAGFATIPEDIVHVAVLMTARAYKEKDNILVVSQSLQGGSITKELSQFKFASMLKEILHWKARKL